MDERKIWSDKKSNVLYVNERYFEKWSPDMAYVLGFFAADGCLTENRKRGNKYIEFISTDYDIIYKIRKVLESEHKISSKKPVVNQKTAYRIQIGSKAMFQGLNRLGFTTNKSLTLNFPLVPRKYLPHFVRGYFDGDGCISEGFYKPKGRKIRKFIITRFTSGSEIFLRELSKALTKNLSLKTGSIYQGINGGYHLAYSKKDSIKLFRHIYTDSSKLYLGRKYKKYCEAMINHGVVA